MRAFENTDALSGAQGEDERQTMQSRPRARPPTPSTIAIVPARKAVVGHLVRKGQTIRIVDLEGQQAVDTLFYRADRFRRALQRAGHVARTGLGLYRRRHGASLQRGQGDGARGRRHAAATTTPRPAPAPAKATRCASAITRKYMHACRENFVARGRRNTACASATWFRNINFFMNVPIEPDGELAIVDGDLEAGRLCRAARRRWTCSA